MTQRDHHILKKISSTSALCRKPVTLAVMESAITFRRYNEMDAEARLGMTGRLCKDCVLVAEELRKDTRLGSFGINPWSSS